MRPLDFSPLFEHLDADLARAASDFHAAMLRSRRHQRRQALLILCAIVFVAGFLTGLAF